MVKARLLAKRFIGGVRPLQTPAFLKPFYPNLPVALGRRSTVNKKPVLPSNTATNPSPINVSPNFLVMT